MTPLSFIAIASVGVTVLALIIKYMRQSKVRQVELSALAFLPGLSKASEARVRWNIARPLSSPLFWLRLLFLLLLLLALLMDGLTFAKHSRASLGVLIAVDRSASMGIGSPNRLQLAEQKASDISAYVKERGGCSRQIFLPDEISSNGNRGEASENGLSLSAMQSAIASVLRGDDRCEWTHLVVLSDLSKPPFFSLDPDAFGQKAVAPHLLWFQIGEPEANSALVDVNFDAADFAGSEARLTLSVASYGDVKGAGSLHLLGPDGEYIEPTDSADLLGQGDKQFSFAVSKPGLYHATLTEAKGLAIDNRLDVELGAISVLPVYLEPTLESSSLGRLLGRIAPIKRDISEDDLVVVAGYGKGASVARRGIYFYDDEAGDASRLGYFDSASPLLEAVDLDLVDKRRLHGLASVPEGFRAVAKGSDGRIWIATRSGKDPAVLMPYPVGGANADLSGNRQLTWLVTLMNAYRFVTSDRKHLLKVDYVSDTGEPLRDVTFESDTAKAVGKKPALTDIQPVARPVAQDAPIWPWLLLMAIVVLLIERAVVLRSEMGRAQ
nr:hypothetical protein [uncultured Cohaesibacter sp.]